MTVDDDTGPWSDGCSLDAADGLWYRTKTLGIATPAQYSGVLCSAASLAGKKQCLPVDCVPMTVDDDTSPWSDECSLDRTDNIWYRTKTLIIKTLAQYGGSECIAESLAAKKTLPNFTQRETSRSTVRK